MGSDGFTYWSVNTSSLFCFTRKASDPLETVIIDNSHNTPMEVVKEYKILGLKISDDLKWNTHVNNTIKKVECISLLSWREPKWDIKN